MSDIEHELVGELAELRARVESLTELARRAILAAVDAQELSSRAHEPWLDEALATLDAP